MKKLKGDRLMVSWHDVQNQPEIGYDGENIIIKITPDKPVHKNWSCIKGKGKITCPEEIQHECMTSKNTAPCIAGFVNLEERK